MARPTVLVLAAALLALLVAPLPGTAAEPIAVGDAAPDFRLNDHTGRAVRLADARQDHWVVLAFYPRASTPGCTKEVCSLRDALADLEGLDARVFGASLDDVVAQARFHEEQELTFALLSDPDGSLAAKYQVLAAGGAYTQRVTFVIDPEGVIRHIDRQVDVLGHGTDVAARLRELQGS